MQASRRAFLFGRRGTPATPWRQFCQRLARTCLGHVKDMGGAHGVDTAWLAPVGADDVLRARALCAQYGVQVALAGVDAATPARATLWLDPCVALTGLEPLADTPGLWRAEAGVRIADLHAVGLPQFADAAPDMTLAAWLASLASTQCTPGRTADVGVWGLDVMLADGTRTALGPFGQHDVQPLRSPVVQQLVPKLFDLVRGEDAQICLAQPRWPARVRLDALCPRSGSVNLAHLLLGHLGTLAWIETAILAMPAADRVDTPPADHSFVSSADIQAADRLDATAKLLFDPGGLFRECPARRMR